MSNCETIISIPELTEVIVIPQVIEVEISTPGLQGIQGPPGQPGAEVFERVASGNIGGHRVVVSNSDGTVSYADYTEPTHAGKVFGLTITAADDGDILEIKRSGSVDFNGWDFDTSLPVFLGENGLLTQTAPTTGFSQIVGFAEIPTRLFLNFREPLKLS